MASTLMRARTRYNKIDIRVSLAGGDHVDLAANAVELGDGGALILRDGDYAVQTVFSPAAWTEVNRR